MCVYPLRYSWEFKSVVDSNAVYRLLPSSSDHMEVGIAIGFLLRETPLLSPRQLSPPPRRWQIEMRSVNNNALDTISAAATVITSARTQASVQIRMLDLVLKASPEDSYVGFSA
ncbi:unnamed protein product [Camellia sinensis]